MATVEQGAKTVVQNWLRIREGEKLTILTDEHCHRQAEVIKDEALKAKAEVKLLSVPTGRGHAGAILEQDPFSSAIDWSETIVGASTYSMLTARKIRDAAASGKRYLSLPLSGKDGAPTLHRDFMQMPTEEAAEMAKVLLSRIRGKKRIHVTTPAGTDLHLSIEGRTAGAFTGDFSTGDPCESSCFEVYISPREDQTHGIMVVDASLGYIGAPQKPLAIKFLDGKIIEIENSEEGTVLKDFLGTFSDDKMLIAAEFGMGLNTCGVCNGDCYIEDESAYGTFHIGIGRNLTLGGENDAAGHNDLVCFHPTIWFDEELVYQDGKIVF